MPIVFVKDTQSRPASQVRPMLDEVNQAVSRTLDLGRNTVWVRYEPGNPDFYWEAESGDVAPGELPVFVFVRLTAGRDVSKIRALFGEIAGAVARTFHMEPFLVWTRIEEMDPDYVAQGGETYSELRKNR